ncbi:hypothetical protein BT96DRAFT_1043167 [Gymnopus androsaceus JB14]|uniref:Wax synthase domain-containing protein n=1 Tax=Gymnopus androsaceus JB14 TaxID=1447944 RepID=A0A6A4HCT6_9AGAR|nr:hypothetical protein BT96DRAFT_1043167 [Gymnopus androsaceus JB14]
MDSAQTVSATATIFGTFNGLSSSFSDFFNRVIPVAGQGLGGIHWHSLSLALARRATATIASALEDYCRLSQMYYTLAILGAVLLRLSAPEDWPPLFGSWGEAWSVRNFWGRTWHQMIRRLCVSPGRSSQKLSGYPPNRDQYQLHLSSYTLHSSFLGSFILSVTIASTNPFPTRAKIKTRLSISVAITLEEVVMRVWASASGGYSAAEQLLSGRSRIRILAFRAIGYLWVLGWFMMTMPLLLDSESNS